MRDYLKVGIVPVFVKEKENKSKKLVNGENIKKIKLPTYCMFRNGKGQTLRFGMLANMGLRRNGIKTEEQTMFALFDTGKQTHKNVGSAIDYSTSISSLIKDYKINIVKADILAYELWHLNKKGTISKDPTFVDVE